MSDEPDDLDLYVQERARQDPNFLNLLAAAERTRALLREVAAAREQEGLTQAELAQRMGTTQSAIARLESQDHDPRLSTFVRYAEMVGLRVELVPKP